MLGAGESQGGHGKISCKMHDSNKKNWAKIMKKMGGGENK